jgi:hypothetical protein
MDEAYLSAVGQGDPSGRWRTATYTAARKE